MTPASKRNTPWNTMNTDRKCIWQQAMSSRTQHAVPWIVCQYVLQCCFPDSSILVAGLHLSAEVKSHISFISRISQLYLRTISCKLVKNTTIHNTSRLKERTQVLRHAVVLPHFAIGHIVVILAGRVHVRRRGTISELDLVGDPLGLKETAHDGTPGEAPLEKQKKALSG